MTPVAPPLCSICLHLVQIKDLETGAIKRNTCKGQGSIGKYRKSKACGKWKRSAIMVLELHNLNCGNEGI